MVSQALVGHGIVTSVGSLMIVSRSRRTRHPTEFYRAAMADLDPNLTQSNESSPRSQPSSSPDEVQLGAGDPWPVGGFEPGPIGPTRRQRIFADWLTDILVYLVVLNLFVEYSDSIVIDSFLISILTAALLKVLLVVITHGKKTVWRWARSKGSRAYTVVGAIGVWAILFLSKFVILGIEDLVFGDLVELGSFIDVMLLVASLVVTREVVRRAYLWLGASGPAH